MKRSLSSNAGPLGQSDFLKNPAPPMVSPRTFIHYLNALWINTEVLLMNVSRLYQFLAGAPAGNDERRQKKLNRFQQALAAHNVELQHQVIRLGGDLVSREQWNTYADAWALAEPENVQSAWLCLHENADLLADLYEKAIALSLNQTGRSNSTFLFAHHLIVINSFLTDAVKTNGKR